MTPTRRGRDEEPLPLLSLQARKLVEPLLGDASVDWRQ
jgi:hypothetical protein